MKKERAYVRELRNRFVTIGKLIFDNGLTIGSGGQISARVEGTDTIMIKPTGYCLGRLKPEEMVIIDMNRKIVEGTLEPSSESPFHLAVYKNRKDINAIVHCHPPTATAFGIAGVELLPLWSEAPPLVAAEGVPIAKWAFPGTDDLGRSILQVLNEKHAVIMENHGCVALGESLEEAYQTAMDVEWLAKIQLISTLIGKPKPLDHGTIGMFQDLQRKFGAHPLCEIKPPA